MTNIDTIDDIVEHIDELCGNGRKCKLQKQLSDRTRFLKSFCLFPFFYSFRDFWVVI